MKKILALILAMSLAFTLFVGCGAQDPAPTTDSTAPTTDSTEPEAEEVSLKTVSMFGATDPALEKYNVVLEEFKAANPHIEVVDESSASDETWKAKIKADFAVGNEPDVILYFTDANSHELISQGKFVDVETIRAEFPEFVDHISDHSFTTAPDGKQYAVSTRGFYEALFCNTDLFEKYDLELPTNWDSLLKAVEVFVANDIVPFAASFSDVPHYMIEHLIIAAGGIEGHKAVPTSVDDIPASWVTAMEQFEVLYNMGAFPVDVNATTNPLVNELFNTKQAAMVVDGSWFVPTDAETAVAMPFPSMTEDNSKAVVGGFTSGWYITEKAWADESKRQALVDFVEAVSTPEFLGSITTVAPCDIPAPTGLSNVAQTGYETFVGAGADLDLPVDSRISGEPWVLWTGSISSLAEGELDATEMLNEVITEFLN